MQPNRVMGARGYRGAAEAWASGGDNWGSGWELGFKKSRETIVGLRRSRWVLGGYSGVQGAAG